MSMSKHFNETHNYLLPNDEKTAGHFKTKPFECGECGMRFNAKEKTVHKYHLLTDHWQVLDKSSLPKEIFAEKFKGKKIKLIKLFLIFIKNL